MLAMDVLHHMWKVQSLEINKQLVSEERTEEIHQIYQQIKMITALDITQSVLHAKQNAYE